MKKIYICQASGIEITKFKRLFFGYSMLFLFLFLNIFQIDYIDISNELINAKQLEYIIEPIFVIGVMYYLLYILIPPEIQIDSFYKLFIYRGRRIQYSTRIENIHSFSIIEDGIILHSDKQIKILFSEFENVDLTSFANSMNKAIESNVNFYKILNINNKIQGFKCLEGENIKQIKEQGYILTNLWWWSHNWPMIIVTAIISSSSITDLGLWFFN